jgi:malonyl-CoA/methylmalonyl-CoA synthetase
LFEASFVRQRHETALEIDTADGQLVTLTFGELDERSSRLARVFAERGCRDGDRVCLYLPNSVAFVDAFLACVKLGVIVVPINVLYREREIGHIIGDAEPRAVVTTAGMFSVCPSGVACWDVEDLFAAGRGMRSDSVRVPIDGEHPAAIVYTSGTTGRSKGAILSHNNFLANAANLLACWRITAEDRYLAVLPLFHVHGLANGLVCWLASGCRMRLVERFDATRAAEWFAAFRPTLFFGVPTMYVRLLDLPNDAARLIGRQARLFVSGSAPLASSVFDAFREKFGHAILERYGMSETLMSVSNPYGAERRPGSVGFPLPGVATRIVTSDGADAGVGEMGELLVRGPNVCLGYWRRPDATAAAFVEGWFRTGDLAERSADGYYTLRGRRSDLIISGGFNIYPREIEELLLEQVGVREAAVVGVSDERRGEVPVAYVVAEHSFDLDALEATCRRELASFKVPRGFVQVDALPRTALGKVQKHLLPPWNSVAI